VRPNDLVVVLVLTAVLVMPQEGHAQQCTPAVYTQSWSSGCYINDGYTTTHCCENQGFYCDGTPATPVECSPGPEYQYCGDIPECATPSNNVADVCTPRFPDPPKECASGVDAQCNGRPDDGCAPCKSQSAGQSEDSDACCQRAAGSDPILLTSRAVATEPFTDFAAASISKLSITRTYNSADSSVYSGTSGGIFGVGWHHDWEGSLSCSGSVCTVSRGLLPAFQFGFAGSYPSLDGTETWNVYTAYAPATFAPTHHNILVQRPSGEWIAYLASGQELHFQTVCSNCWSSSCNGPLNGGNALLSKVVDLAGNSVTVTYNPDNGLLLGLADDLGHALQLTNPQYPDCPLYPSELDYDGVVVAKYQTSGNYLSKVTDASGSALRSYLYVQVPGVSMKAIQAVLNEAGMAIAQFSYSSYGSGAAASGIIDSGSSVQVSYARNTQSRTIDATVTEYYHGAGGDTSATSIRQFDYFGDTVSVSDSCACGSPRTMQWTAGRVTCSIDALGHVTKKDVDTLGRVQHQVEYSGQGCTPPSPLPPDSREEWFQYGVTKPIVQGLSLALDAVSSVTRNSTLGAGSFTEQTDYNQGSSPLDPPGYACTQSALPAGSVACRQISSGYVVGPNGPTFEQHGTFLSYDSRGRLIKKYGPVNLTSPGPNDVTPIEARTYWVDNSTPERQGRLYQVMRYASPTAQPLVTTYDYDMFGVSRDTAPDGTQTMLIKDGRGRTTFVLNADAGGVVRAQTETRYYDGSLPRLRILPSGAAEQYSYDAMGRLSEVKRLAGDPESSGANPALGWTESYLYDQAGNRIHSQRLDAQGNITWQQDRAYDVRHRVVWESNPSLPSAAKSWTYDSAGFLTGTQDEEGRSTTFTPDSLSRVLQVTRSGPSNPTGATVATYQYTPFQDTLGSVTDANAHATSYTYDDFGRIANLSSANLSRGGGGWFGYDARGNLLGRGDQNITVSYSYDGLDRVLSMNAQNSVDGSSVGYQYRYDENGFTGKLTTILEPDRTVYRTYDWAGRVLTEVRAENGISVPLTTGYSYDADGALQQLSYPSGLTVQFNRDPATREIVNVQNVSNGNSYASNITRYPGGPIKSLTYGNGRTATQTVNLRYEPVAIHDGPVWLTYTTTPSGDIEVATDQSEVPSGSCVRNVSRIHTYDFQDRLQSWNDVVQTGSGICPADSLSNTSGTLTYSAGTDQVAGQGVNQGYAFGYDLAGNVSALGQYDSTGTTITQAVCLRHDALGRLVLFGATNTSLTPGGTACVTDAEVATPLARFMYDSSNRRVAREVNSQWTYVVFDGTGNPLSEFAMAGGVWTKTRDYVWLAGRLLAQIEYEASSVYTYYAHADQLGTPRALTNSNGQLVWGTFQRPYGEVGETTVADPLSGHVEATKARLPGQYDERLFPLAGLNLQGPYYNWNRWYLPSLGRYLEVDPAKLKDPVVKAQVGDKTMPVALSDGPTLPWYSYALENPLRYTDSTGEWPGFMILDPRCRQPCEDFRQHVQDSYSKQFGCPVTCTLRDFTSYSNDAVNLGGPPRTIKTCICAGKCSTPHGDSPWWGQPNFSPTPN